MVYQIDYCNVQHSKTKIFFCSSQFFVRLSIFFIAAIPSTEYRILFFFCFHFISHRRLKGHQRTLSFAPPFSVCCLSFNLSFVPYSFFPFSFVSNSQSAPHFLSFCTLFLRFLGSLMHFFHVRCRYFFFLFFKLQYRFFVLGIIYEIWPRSACT